MQQVSLGGTTPHCVVDACQTRLFASRLELKETHIAACVLGTEATLEAISMARKLHIPRTVGFACCVLILTTYHFMKKVSAGL